MHSHYLASGARWAVLAAMVTYAMGVGVAPALHFAEDGAEMNAYLVALTDQPTPPPPHHVPDGVDCLFCQVLSSPADSGLVGTPILDAPASPVTADRARAIRPEDPLTLARHARGPPQV